MKTSDTTNDGTRYIEARRIRCPKCRSDDLQTIRTYSHERPIRRRTQCRKCYHKFFVLIVG